MPVPIYSPRLDAQAQRAFRFPTALETATEPCNPSWSRPRRLRVARRPVQGNKAPARPSALVDLSALLFAAADIRESPGRVRDRCRGKIQRSYRCELPWDSRAF